MKKILFAIFLLSASYAFAQDTVPPPPPPPPPPYLLDTTTKSTDIAGKVFVVVEQMPAFPGGDKKLFKFLKKNIKYPKEARRKEIEGRVYISFVIDEQGMVQDVRVIKGVSPELDEEAVRVVKLMPKWTPGSQKGKPIKVQYTLPIIFHLK
jgi:protein TonB